MTESKFYNATVDKPDNATVLYKIGNADPIEKSGLIAAFKALGVGRHDVTVSVAGDAKYSGISKQVQINITPAAFTWTSALTDGGWEWGDANKNLFAEPTVSKAYADDVVSFTFAVKDGGTYTTYDAMKTAVTAFGEGTYEITVTASNKNYSDLTKTVRIVIVKASFKWQPKPASANWFWNDKWTATDGGRVITQPSLLDKANRAVTLTYSVDGQEFADDFDGLVAYLQSNERNAKAYTVTVSIATTDAYYTDLIANYNALTDNTFTVTVKQAINAWKTNCAPQTSIIKEYGKPAEGMVQAQAEFGTVQYKFTKNGVATTTDDYAELIAWINSLASSDTAYTFQTVAESAEGNFTSLTAVTSVTVKGIGAAWANETEYAAAGNTIAVTYGNSLSGVVVPYKTWDATEIPELKDATLRFAVSYKTWTSNETRMPDLGLDNNIASADAKATAEKIQNWLQGAENYGVREAGTYTITVTYTSGSNDYASLSATITVTINRAPLVWTESTLPANLYNRAYGDFANVLTPTAGNGHAVKYTVTGDKTESFKDTDKEGFTLAGYLGGLSVGAYTITYEVESTNNYEGLTARTFNVTIYKASNNWTPESLDKLTNLCEYKRGETINLFIPEPLRGTVRFVVGTTQLSAGLNEYLNDTLQPTAKDYTVSFIVDDDVNYNGLRYDLTLRISKNPNKWEEGEAPDDTYTWKGAVGTFKIPVANVHPELLRFDIVKAGDPDYAKANTDLDQTAFITALNAITYGTYTVTMRIGSNEEYDSNKAIRDYNLDYELLTGTTTIVFERAGNSFTENLLTAKRFTYGTAVTLNKPVAEQGNNAIVYAIIGTKLDGTAFEQSFDSAKDTQTVKAFDQFVAALSALPAGSYTVSATIGQTNAYESATTSAMYIVDKATTAWTLTDTQLAAYKNKSFTWGTVPADLLPTMAIANWEGGVIVYTFDGRVIQNTEGTEFNEGTWIYWVRKSVAGTYPLTAYVTGDNDHTDLLFEATVTINKVVTAWTNSATELASKQSIGWTIDDATHDTLPTLTVANWTGAQIKYSVTTEGKDGSTTITGDWNTYIGTQLGVGKHTVTAFVQGDANHTDLTFESVVEIRIFETKWTNETALNASRAVTMAYGETPALPVPAANWTGTGIKYYITEKGTKSQITEGNWNNALTGKGVGTYYVSAEIETDGKHTALSFEITVTVTGVTTAWTNLTELEKSKTVSWQYGATPPTLPIPVSDWADAQIKYYVIVSNQKSEIENGNWNKDLAGKNAGTYVFRAEIKGDGGHSDLSFEITATVTPVTVAWNASPANGASYTWTYDADKGYTNVPTQPTLSNWSGATVTYTLAKNGGTGNLSSGNSWDTLIGTLKNQPAGTYVITASVTGDVNHVAPIDHTQTVVIGLADNEWVTGKHVGDGVAITWKFGGNDAKITVGESTQAYTGTIAYESAQNDGALKIYINNSQWFASAEYATLDAYLRARPVGNYTVTVTVPANDKYDALTETITVTVTRAANGWKVADGKAQKLEISTGWEWSDTNIGLKAPLPMVGNSVNISVTKIATKSGETDTVVIATALSYYEDGSVNTNDVSVLTQKIVALDAGTYKISASIAISGNYDAYYDAAEDITFTIAKAQNGWDTNPTIAGWQYGNNLPQPTSEPKFGNANDVKYYFAPAADPNDSDCEKVEQVTAWSENLPNAQGSYYLKGVLAESDNYTGLTGYKLFVIGVGTNEWVDVPSVTSWNWNGYNRTVNLFRASAQSKGKVTFTIQKAGKQANTYVALATSDFLAFDNTVFTTDQIAKLRSFGLVALNGVFDAENADANKYVPTDVAVLLSALKPGTYYMYVVAAPGNNYGEKNGTFEFKVDIASNEWKIDGNNPLTPNVQSFVFESTDNFVAGTAKYGDITYRVTGKDNNQQAIDSGEKTEEAINTFINGLNAGRYVLQAWVLGDTAYGTYNAFYSASAPYSVVFEVTRAENRWENEDTFTKNITETYLNLHGDKSLTNLFVTCPQAAHGDVTYQILDNSQKVMYDDLVYSVSATDENSLWKAILALEAGDYFIRATVAQSDNYMSIFANTVLSITSTPNSLKHDVVEGDGTVTEVEFKPQTEVSAKWNDDPEKANYSAYFTEIKAEGTQTVVYTYNNKQYTYNEFVTDVLEKSVLDVGKHNVTISIAAGDGYEEVRNYTYTFDIQPSDNGWEKVKDEESETEKEWNIAESLVFAMPQTTMFRARAATTTVTKNWQYATEIFFACPTPLLGHTVIVQLVQVDDYGNELEVARSFEISTNNADIFLEKVGLVNKALSNLSAGNYRFTVSVPVSKNWNPMPAAEILLTVTKNMYNDWQYGCEPEIRDYQTKEVVSSWNFGTSVYVPDSTKAKFGEYYVEYHGSNGVTSMMPTDAGDYVAVFKVDETPDYNGFELEIPFTIQKVLYDSYSVLPGVVAWAWGEYDRTENLFTGIALSGGNVSYTILQNGVAVSKDLSGMQLGDLNDKHYDDEPSKNTYVSKKHAELIGKLLAGDYTLRVSFAATTNYEAFHRDVPFKIEVARNEWTVVPNVSPWTVNHWTAKDSTPNAESRHGNPTITITGKAEGKVYYRATYDPATKAYKADISLLNSAPTGWYTLTAWVDGESGKYSALERTSYDFQIFIQGSLDEKNGWAVSPSITAWRANTNNQYGTIIGTPYRGLPYFEFYTAVESSNGEFKLGKLIEKGTDAATVAKADTYYKDFYVPMAPGTYFMVAKAVYEADGKVVTSQSIEDSPRMFVIGNRDNSFTQDVRIATTLWLGEKATWQQPTAFASLADSKMLFSYYDEKGNFVGNEIPTAPGDYTLVATASAKYSNPITSEIKFTVALSQNAWVNDQSPTIQGWSEEFSTDAPNPVGQALHGEIVYTYANVNTPDKRVTEKPLTAGTYIMYATVELDGYITLESKHTFTVEEAFDSTLVLIDTILGLIACAFAVVVIIFAIRRYKENG